MTYSKVEDHPHLIRDNKTTAILNTDQAEYENYLIRSRLSKNEGSKIQSLEQELITIKDEMTEIKCLIKELLHATR